MSSWLQVRLSPVLLCGIIYCWYLCRYIYLGTVGIVPRQNLILPVYKRTDSRIPKVGIKDSVPLGWHEKCTCSLDVVGRQLAVSTFLVVVLQKPYLSVVHYRPPFFNIKGCARSGPTYLCFGESQRKQIWRRLSESREATPGHSGQLDDGEVIIDYPRIHLTLEESKSLRLE